MNVWIVLIRGINVGGRVLLMKRLVALMEKVGCSDVKTYIQSGNVVCKSKLSDAEVLASKIGKAILANEGYEPRVMVLSRAQFEAAIAANTYPVAEPKLVHLFFLDAPPTPANLKALDALKTATEQYTLDGTTFYLYAPDGFGTSKLAASFEKIAKVAATARNWRTVTALQELVASYDTNDVSAKSAARVGSRVRKPAATRATANQRKR